MFQKVMANTAEQWVIFSEGVAVPAGTGGTSLPISCIEPKIYCLVFVKNTAIVDITVNIAETFTVKGMADQTYGTTPVTVKAGADYLGIFQGICAGKTTALKIVPASSLTDATTIPVTLSML